MDTLFESILKGSPWENMSEYLYHSLNNLTENYNKKRLNKSLQYKIDLCNSIIACSKNYSVTIGNASLTDEQSALAKKTIKENLIAEYYNLGMGKYVISVDDALNMLHMGLADDWICDYYEHLEMEGELCLYQINYNFISRHIDDCVADFYLDYLWNDMYQYPEGIGDCERFSEEDMKRDISFLKFVQSLLPKGRPQNIVLKHAVELFFERCCDKDCVDGCQYVTFYHPDSKYIWLLYYPHTNNEYHTIYKCLDYFDLIDKDIKENWNKTDTKYQEQSYIKKIVSMLKAKHPMREKME